MTEIELLPCPFCGGGKTELSSNGQNVFWRYCEGCGSEGPTAPTEDAADKAWNTRHPLRSGEGVGKPEILLALASISAAESELRARCKMMTASRLHDAGNVLRALSSSSSRVGEP